MRPLTLAAVAPMDFGYIFESITLKGLIADDLTYTHWADLELIVGIFVVCDLKVDDTQV